MNSFFLNTEQLQYRTEWKDRQTSSSWVFSSSLTPRQISVQFRQFCGLAYHLHQVNGFKKDMGSLQDNQYLSAMCKYSPLMFNYSQIRNIQ